MLPIRRIYASPNLFHFNLDLLDNLFDVSVFDDAIDKCPIHDIIENSKEYIIEAMMAGVKKEDVSIELEDKELRIAAERKEIKDLKYNRKESFTGFYKRLFILPDNANSDNISATLENGILRIVVPKHTEAQKPIKKQIEIK